MAASSRAPVEVSPTEVLEEVDPGQRADPEQACVWVADFPAQQAGRPSWVRESEVPLPGQPSHPGVSLALDGVAGERQQEGREVSPERPSCPSSAKFARRVWTSFMERVWWNSETHDQAAPTTTGMVRTSGSCATLSFWILDIVSIGLLFS